MEVAQESDTPGVDPEVKAFVYSLVSALGGSSAGDDGRYVLGDDALAVLKDIKRWLRLYDDKLNRLDVARLLSDANLVKGDLLEILASWPEDVAEGSFRSKIALLCVDLLTQLTWPIVYDEQNATIDRYFHLPSLRIAHAGYKSAVLHHPSSKMLRTVARVCLPAMAQAREDRSPQEDNIIKVVLYFFRNIAMITQPPGVAVDEIESGIDRSTTIEEFHNQDIFNLMLAICSNMTEAFESHDVEILDTLFHIVKGINAEKLFMDKSEVVSANTRELKQLMGKEKGMLATYARYAPSRHNRFGTMMWIQRDGGRRSTLFGQKSAAHEQLSMAEIDAAKKWRKPRRPVKIDQEQQPNNAFDADVHLTPKARKRLASFVEQFLDSSFNPLFLNVRKAIEREESRVMESHRRQYLYLVSWFLRAESARREKQGSKQSAAAAESSVESFALVATVLNQETFVLISRFMEEALDKKRWQDLNAGMKCFTQILSTVQDMSESTNDEDQEIAENILNRIFYEQTTHDRIIALLRSYKDQGFGYLDACTELAHVFLRLLERYSKQNVDMQVRSRRRARKRKAAARNSNNGSEGGVDGGIHAEDVVEAQRISTERKFDFNRFAARFINQASVDTFVALLRHYKDLNDTQLKRAHRFFYRIAFKMEMTVFLFRMDIITLLNRLIRGPEGLNIDNPTFKEWEELVRQVFRRLIKRMQDRPALAIELLFSKIPSTMFYLEHGYDKEPERKIARPVAELEIKPGMQKEDQIGVVVTVLINQGKFDHLAWLKKLALDAAKERREWQDAQTAIQSIEEPAKPYSLDGGDVQMAVSEERNSESTKSSAPAIIVKGGSDEQRQALHRDKYLRLLLSVVGFERMVHDAEASETTWFIPSEMTPEELEAIDEQIQRFEFQGPIFEDESKSAEDFIRRKAAPRVSHANDDEDDGIDHDDEEGISDLDDLLELREQHRDGGPTIAAASRKKLTSRKRQRRSADELLDDRGLEERKEATKRLELDRLRKIKSSLFVHDSDEESDEERDREFFAKEAKMRTEVQRGVIEAEMKAREQDTSDKAIRKGKIPGKRKSTPLDEEASSNDSDANSMDTDDDDDEGIVERPGARKRRKMAGGRHSSSNSDAKPPSSRKRINARKSKASLAAANDTESEEAVSEADDTSAETDTETPASSQLPSSGQTSQIKGGEVTTMQTEIEDDARSDSDKENQATAAPAVKPAVVPRRRVRAGFIIESDSDE